MDEERKKVFPLMTKLKASCNAPHVLEEIFKPLAIGDLVNVGRECPTLQKEVAGFVHTNPELLQRVKDHTRADTILTKPPQINGETDLMLEFYMNSDDCEFHTFDDHGIITINGYKLSSFSFAAQKSMQIAHFDTDLKQEDLYINGPLAVMLYENKKTKGKSLVIIDRHAAKIDHFVHANRYKWIIPFGSHRFLALEPLANVFIDGYELGFYQQGPGAIIPLFTYWEKCCGQFHEPCFLSADFALVRMCHVCSELSMFSYRSETVLWKVDFRSEARELYFKATVDRGLVIVRKNLSINPRLAPTAKEILFLDLKTGEAEFSARVEGKGEMGTYCVSPKYIVAMAIPTGGTMVAHVLDRKSKRRLEPIATDIPCEADRLEVSVKEDKILLVKYRHEGSYRFNLHSLDYSFPAKTYNPKCSVFIHPLATGFICTQVGFDWSQLLMRFSVRTLSFNGINVISVNDVRNYLFGKPSRGTQLGRRQLSFPGEEAFNELSGSLSSADAIAVSQDVHLPVDFETTLNPFKFSHNDNSRMYFLDYLR